MVLAATAVQRSRKGKGGVAGNTSPHSPSIYGIRTKAALELFYKAHYVDMASIL